jgi:hypothetical protein
VVASYRSLAQKAINELLAKLAREIENLVGELGKLAIDYINKELAAAKAGDIVLGLLVTAHQGNRIELQYRDFLKYGFAKVRFAIDDKLNYGPEYFHNLEIRAILGDIRISKEDSYEVILGYGFDNGPPAYEAARGKIALKTPSISIDAFLAGSPDNGFVIDFGLGTGNSGSSDFPLIIPLGPSGFGMQGIGGTFADNFRPNLAPNSVNEPERPTASDYITWAQQQARKPLDGWRPLRAGEGHVGGVGLRTDIIDLCTNGFLFRIMDAGFLALSDGPLVVQGGRGQLLQLPRSSFSLDAISVLDFKTLTYAVLGAATFRMPGDPNDWELIAARGAITAQISLLNSRDWFLNIGTDGAPITGSFLKDWFSAQVFVMTNFERIDVGARLTWGGREIDFLGMKFDAYFGMQVRARLGIQPIHFEGSLILFGGIGIRIWKFKIGVELSGIVTLAVLKPFRLRIAAGWRIGMPWPLSDLSGTITLIDRDNPELADIALPLLLLAAKSTAGHFGGQSEGPKQKLGALHPISGLQFDIVDEASEIWPDCEIALPFYKKLTDDTGKILSPAIGSSREGGVTVQHSLKQLSLYQIKDGSEVEVQGLQGVWVVGPAKEQGDFNSPTARLHFPANDPFRWLDQHQDRTVETTVLPPVGNTFDFGIGAAQFSQAEISLPSLTIRRLGESGGIDLVSDPLFMLPTRVARFARASFGGRDAGAGTTLSRAILTCVSNDPEAFRRIQCNLAIDVLSVVDQQLPSGRTIYFGRLEVRDASGADFDNFTLSYNDDAACAVGVTVLNERCVPLLALYRVTLFAGHRTMTTINERKVFEPGVYRIVAAGRSEWSARGSPKDGSWIFEQKFRVTYPPTITPYIAYVTLGDERPYRLLGTGLWNPTPYGLGFPFYSGLKASIVFRPDYFKAIFNELSIAYDGINVVPPPKVDTSKLGERFDSASSAKWQTDAGGFYKEAQEVLFDAPTGPGVRELAVGFFNPLTNANVKLDSWSFETSRFVEISDHLTLDIPIVSRARNTVSEVFAAHEDAKIAELDTTVVTKPVKVAATFPASWRLPPIYEPEHKNFEMQSALSFLRFFERSSIPISPFNADPMYGLLDRPERTLIEALTDRDGKTFCFWIRTPEPLDWRRLSANLQVYATKRNAQGAIFLPDVSPVSLKTLFTPSPDGTSALMFAQIGETFVRLPAGLYVFKASFMFDALGLPHLRNNSDPQQKSASFELRFANTFGPSFTGALN